MTVVNVLPVRIREDRMKHHVIERLPTHGDLQPVHDDEVKCDHITRVMNLRELDALLNSMF